MSALDNGVTDMDFSKIQAAIESVVRANGGKAFVNANTVDRLENVRLAAERLAVACGVPEPKQQGLSSEKLAMLYATARKSMNGAISIAKGIADTETPNIGGGLDDILGEAPTPPAPMPSPDAVNVERLIELVRKEAATMADYVAKDRLDGVMSKLEAFAERAAKHATSEAFKAMQPLTVTVQRPDAKPIEVGLVHERFPLLVRALGLGDHVYLHGPAGSGKTTAAKQAATALELPFHFTGKVESEYALLGFTRPDGGVHRTPFREAFERGGLFLFDEIDRSDAGAITAINAALANGFCAFPDGTVNMHDTFKCIAGGNTTMTGPDTQYSAGVQQDASAIDRFAFIQWDYDLKLERALAPNGDWCDYVQQVRVAIAERALDHLVTPRATIRGGHWINAGESWKDTADAILWKGLDADTIAQVAAAVGPPSFQQDNMEQAA